MKNKNMKETINEWREKNKDKIQKSKLNESVDKVNNLSELFERIDGWLVDTKQFLRERKDENKRNI